MLKTATAWMIVWGLLASCSTPEIDLTSWRLEHAQPRAEEARGELEAEFEQLQLVRARDLEDGRKLALALVAENPLEPLALIAASRGESDGMLLFPDDKGARNHAAASSLDYAERAVAAGAEGAPFLAQLAWALGTTTHLQSMGDRSDHAHRTIEVARSALALDPNAPQALATLALVNLRLETLPWIAKVMARSRPESSLEEAERLARAALDAAPSRENRLILAKVLIAADREDEAGDVLRRALESGSVYPRDPALEDDVRMLLEGLD